MDLDGDGEIGRPRDLLRISGGDGEEELRLSRAWLH